MTTGKTIALTSWQSNITAFYLFIFLLFHQFYWSYIQNSLYKSFKITSYYKNSLQFSSDCTNLIQETIFTNTYFSYKNTLVQKISLYTLQKILCSFFFNPFKHHFRFPITAYPSHSINQFIICSHF